MRRPLVLLFPALLLALVGCGGDDGGDSAEATTSALAPATTVTASTAAQEPATTVPTTDAPGTTVAATTEAPTTTAPPDPLTILVTNDDGIDAPGIDALVAALSALPDVEIVVVAPATNQSGTSDTTSAAPVTWAADDTVSGVAGIAVAGTPADSVLVAVDELGIVPDVIVSGVNSGQNIGIFVPLSRTVGAARTAARRGIPAIAISAGPLDGPDFATAARLAAEEVAALRATLGPEANDEHVVVNLNVPTCPTSSPVRGVVDVPVAAVFPEGTDGLNMTFDCTSTATDPADDATAMLVGFASRSIVPADL